MEYEITDEHKKYIVSKLLSGIKIKNNSTEPFIGKKDNNIFFSCVYAHSKSYDECNKELDDFITKINKCHCCNNILTCDFFDYEPVRSSGLSIIIRTTLKNMNFKFLGYYERRGKYYTQYDVSQHINI